MTAGVFICSSRNLVAITLIMSLIILLGICEVEQERNFLPQKFLLFDLRISRIYDTLHNSGWNCSKKSQESKNIFRSCKLFFNLFKRSQIVSKSLKRSKKALESLKESEKVPKSLKKAPKV